MISCNISYFPLRQWKLYYENGRGRVLAHPWISIFPTVNRRRPHPILPSWGGSGGELVNNLLGALVGRGALMRLTSVVMPSSPQPDMLTFWW